MLICKCGHDRGEHERDGEGYRFDCMVAVGVLECVDGELVKSVAACPCGMFVEEAGLS